MERRWGVALFADVAGYCRLTEADEEGTLGALLQALDMISAAVTFWNGHVVHCEGDGVLAEFQSADAAILSIVQALSEVSKWNGQRPVDHRLKFRVGMSYGPLMGERNDIYGITVNEAARLQEMARPGQVLVSSEVFDIVRNGIDVGFAYIGERALKGLNKPTKVYQVLLDPSTIGRAIGKTEFKTPTLRWASASLIAALVIILGLMAQGLRPEPELINTSMAAHLTVVYPLFEKPKINLQSFDYVGRDPEFRYVLESFAESLARSLARYSNLHVLVLGKTEGGAQILSKGHPQLEQEQSRFLVSVTTSETKHGVTINVKFTDAMTARNWIGHWSAESGIAWISPEVGIIEDISAELRKQVLQTVYDTILQTDTDSVEAFDLAMRGLEIYWRFTKNDNTESQRIFVEVTSLDPGFVKAWLALAWTYFNEAQFGWSETPDVPLTRSRELALRISAFDEFKPQAEALVLAIDRFRRGTLKKGA